MDAPWPCESCPWPDDCAFRFVWVTGIPRALARNPEGARLTSLRETVPTDIVGSDRESRVCWIHSLADSRNGSLCYKPGSKANQSSNLGHLRIACLFPSNSADWAKLIRADNTGWWPGYRHITMYTFYTLDASSLSRPSYWIPCRLGWSDKAVSRAERRIQGPAILSTWRHI